MLIFANGAHKSGSTWLMHLSLELRPCEEPPEIYRNPKWTTPPYYSIQFHRLAEMLADRDVLRRDVLFKLHLQDPKLRSLVLAHPAVRTLNIRRDLRDVVVSQYHHWVRDERISGTFEQFYWGAGRNRAWMVLRHHLIWDVTSPRYLCLEYEDLLTDFPAQLRRLAAFLETTVTDERIAEIQHRTSPTEINRRFEFGPMNRTRKGGSGDWRSYFNEEQLTDLMMLGQRIKQPLVAAGVQAVFPVDWLNSRLSRIPRARRR
jgi:hypothetical protein